MSHRRRRVRRRRTSNIGVIVRCTSFLGVVCLCVVAVRWLGRETQSYVENSSFSKSLDLSSLATFRPRKIQSRNRRIVYPYSIVPGGVRSADELRAAADDDPLVAAHYSGFVYQHARVVEVQQPKLVYLSYRKDDHIYWTRKQASLHVGEKLLTDGKITARTRCGNQVSVLPQPDTSPNEPAMAQLDTPDAAASGFEELFPEITTNPLEADPGMPLSSSSGNGFAGGPPPGGFMPMPIGVGGIGTPIANNCPPSNTSNSKKCGHNPPPPPPPPVVPEPGTIVFMLSGVTALAARYRYFKR